MRVVVEENCFAPERYHLDDAGYDLRSPSDVIIMPHSSETINTGVHFELPVGPHLDWISVGFVKSRSSMMKRGIYTDGTIDAGYRGAVKVVLDNHSDEPQAIYRGDKIAQIVILQCLTPEVEIVDSLSSTDRADGGFGSTGR